MVDFSKRLSGKKIAKVIDPIQLYETLDRAHDKGPLRPAQIEVLKEWVARPDDQRDVIVKLHTGQGKTLIGLLMLQSRLNDGQGPALYLCPDNYLVDQTCEQADQFGIHTCTADGDLPEEFLNGEKILVTSVQKLFNGLTKFKLNPSSVPVNTFLMDDAHACSDRIREACRIRIPKTDAAYGAIRDLFGAELEKQGAGTYADIRNGKYDALLPVPYWAWDDKQPEVVKILAAGTDRQPIRFAWPILKDMLAYCQCVVSGAAVEIEPYIAPLDMFGSYWNSAHRIFMSATVTDDAFLVKGLQLTPETILDPLVFSQETWSGEKMVLLPSIIDDELDRDAIVAMLAKPRDQAASGRVAIVPGFRNTKDWESYGATIADRDTIYDVINGLRQGDYGTAVVLVNRYDGIDLPDRTCRILIFDGRPYSESLIDLYEESCRPESQATMMRIVRTIEQGLGRSVRGEKDFSVIVMLGPELVRIIRDKKSRIYLSNQTATQLDIGLEIADMARQEIADGQDPRSALVGLIRQCLRREDDWKRFYAESMTDVKISKADASALVAYRVELEAEQRFRSDDHPGAIKVLQSGIDSKKLDASDKPWYLQQIARYQYRSQRTVSQKTQMTAFVGNRLLLKPETAQSVTKLTVISSGRMDRIIEWAHQFDSYSELDIAVSDILSRLAFGVIADRFEGALKELGEALGFGSERPDKEWKEGPDNLWALDSVNYILWECKDEVSLDRAEINKRETEQMNRSCAWFEKHYAGFSAHNIIIHPSRNVAKAAAFTHKVDAMRDADLKRLVLNVRQFFKGFEALNLNDLSATYLHESAEAFGLSVSNLLSRYARPVKDL